MSKITIAAATVTGRSELPQQLGSEVLQSLPAVGAACFCQPANQMVDIPFSSAGFQSQQAKQLSARHAACLRRNSYPPMHSCHA